MVRIQKELKTLQMAEATKDMMRDDGEEGGPESSTKESFVQLMFTKPQFKTSSELKNFILRIAQVSPQYIDL